MKMNPWKKIDLNRSAKFGPTDPIEAAIEREQIELSYQCPDTDSQPCGYPGCKETAYLRPTVGTLMCANRHVLSHSGDWR